MAARRQISRAMQADIEDFILHLATERGLSDNYQLSTRRSLETFAAWAQRKQLAEPAAVTLAHLQDFLAERKRAGLAASSIKLEIVALKIFFRWLALRTRIPHDVADVLPLPRLERYLPETLNEMLVEKLLAAVDTTQPLGLRDRVRLRPSGSPSGHSSGWTGTARGRGLLRWGLP